MVSLVLYDDISYHKTFSNATAFFEANKPPFFEDKTVVIVDGEADCFNVSNVWKTITLFIIFTNAIFLF